MDPALFFRSSSPFSPRNQSPADSLLMAFLFNQQQQLQQQQQQQQLVVKPPKHKRTDDEENQHPSKRTKTDEELAKLTATVDSLSKQLTEYGTANESLRNRLNALGKRVTEAKLEQRLLDERDNNRRFVITVLKSETNVQFIENICNRVVSTSSPAPAACDYCAERNLDCQQLDGICVTRLAREDVHTASCNDTPPPPSEDTPAASGDVAQSDLLETTTVSETVASETVASETVPTPSTTVAKVMTRRSSVAIPPPPSVVHFKAKAKQAAPKRAPRKKAPPRALKTVLSDLEWQALMLGP